MSKTVVINISRKYKHEFAYKSTILSLFLGFIQSNMSKNQELYDAVRKGSLEQVENFLTEPGMVIACKYQSIVYNLAICVNINCHKLYSSRTMLNCD